MREVLPTVRRCYPQYEGGVTCSTREVLSAVRRRCYLQYAGGLTCSMREVWWSTSAFCPAACATLTNPIRTRMSHSWHVLRFVRKNIRTAWRTRGKISTHSSYCCEDGVCSHLQTPVLKSIFLTYFYNKFKSIFSQRINYSKKIIATRLLWWAVWTNALTEWDRWLC